MKAITCICRGERKGRAAGKLTCDFELHVCLASLATLLAQMLVTIVCMEHRAYVVKL